MAQLLSAAVQDVLVVDGAFGLVDEACEGEGAADRLPECAWVRAGSGSVFLETSDSSVLQARLRIEVWDAAIPMDQAYWPDQARLSLRLPTARLIVDEIDAGWEKGPELPSPGRWQLRVGRLEAPEELPWGAAMEEDIEACLLLQFWPDVTVAEDGIPPFSS